MSRGHECATGAGSCDRRRTRRDARFDQREKTGRGDLRGAEMDALAQGSRVARMPVKTERKR